MFYPVDTDQLLNHSLTLIFGWEMSQKCNIDQPNQPQINQISTWFQPFFNDDMSTSNLVEFWWDCGWEVDFWLIIVAFSTHFSTKYQCWGCLRKVEAQCWISIEELICTHWVIFELYLYQHRLTFMNDQSIPNCQYWFWRNIVCNVTMKMFMFIEQISFLCYLVILSTISQSTVIIFPVASYLKVCQPWVINTGWLHLQLTKQ